MNVRPGLGYAMARMGGLLPVQFEAERLGIWTFGRTGSVGDAIKIDVQLPLQVF